MVAQGMESNEIFACKSSVVDLIMLKEDAVKR